MAVWSSLVVGVLMLSCGSGNAVVDAFGFWPDIPPSPR